MRYAAFFVVLLVDDDGPDFRTLCGGCGSPIPVCTCATPEAPERVEDHQRLAEQLARLERAA